MRFQHWGLINYVHAKSLLIQGDHLFFKLLFFGGRRRLIHNGMLINPDLTLQETSLAELLGGEGADFLRWVAFWSIRSSGLLRWFCVTSAALRMTSHHFFLAGALLSTGGLQKSQKALARGQQLCTQLSIFEGRFAELLCFRCCQVQKLKKSRRIASFWMLSSSKNEEVSQNCFVFDVVSTSKKEEVSQNCFVFDVVTCKHWGSLEELLRVWCCQLWKMRKTRRIAAFLMFSILKNEKVSQNN